MTLAIVLGSFLVGLTLLAALFHAASEAFADRLTSEGAADRPGRGSDEFPRLQEIWSAGDGEIKVVRIPLRGMLMLGDGRGWRGSDEAGAEFALRSIRRATLDPDVAGILLEVDSGGGGITASDILYDALMRFKQAGPQRVVVAHLGDMAASGAYYVSLAADRIVAHPTTITGSIGVILSSYNIRELAERIGIRDASILSGDHKDLLSPFKDMRPEQQAMLQQIVDQLHALFVSRVTLRRALPEEQVRPLADGRILLAEQAREAGLLDAIGYLPEAQVAMQELLGVDQVRYVRYGQRMTLQDLFRSPGFWGRVVLEAVPSFQRRFHLVLQ